MKAIDSTPAEKKSVPSKQYVENLYEKWFLEYASYVILDRAIPHNEDGLKPVQRRVLFAMGELDDGRYHKAANIIGHTMCYHPHGDTAIFDALVKLAQKGFLIDTQGNWGNPVTGDKAAAARYVEARLTPFAKEILFNNNNTEWNISYDGRSKEPKILPTKFPLLLLLGVEGIAVGLATKILPHNFCELMQESIAFLQGHKIQILPDFPTGGKADFTEYEQGKRGGKVVIRASINIVGEDRLMIREIPYGTTTSSLIASILSAHEKGKIKIKKIEDNTAEDIEILVFLDSDVYPKTAMESLYAFTDCEVSTTVNCCVIKDNKPRFLDTAELLKLSTLRTKNYLKKELQEKIKQLKIDIRILSLEKIFIEEKVYQSLDRASSWDELKNIIRKRMQRCKLQLQEEITDRDIEKLVNLKIKKIAKYDQIDSQENYKKLMLDLKSYEFKLENLTDYTIKFFQGLLKTYGKGKVRRTSVEQFTPVTVEHQSVLPKKTFFFDKKECLLGYGLKNGDSIGKYTENSCFIILKEDGFFRIVKGESSTYIGKNTFAITLYQRKQLARTFHILWQEGARGPFFAKRFYVQGVATGKDYSIVKNSIKSKVVFFSHQDQIEEEVISVKIKDPLGIVTATEIKFLDFEVKKHHAQGELVLDGGKIIEIKKNKTMSKLLTKRCWFDRKEGELNTKQKGVYLGKLDFSNHLVLISSCGELEVVPFLRSFKTKKDILEIKKLAPAMHVYLIYSKSSEYYLNCYRLSADFKKKRIFSYDDDHQIHFVSFEKNPEVKITYLDKVNRKRNTLSLDLENTISQKDSSEETVLLSYGLIEKIES